jgi:hypothetical protein
MDMLVKRELKEKFEKNLENLCHDVQRRDHRPTLPYGNPMHLAPLISTLDVVKKSFNDDLLQSGSIPLSHEEITKKYGTIKKELEFVKEDIKKRVHLDKIKEVYIGERKYLQTKNNIPDYQKYSKARDLRDSISKIKKCMSNIEKRIEKRISNIDLKIKDLETLKKNFEFKLKNDSVSQKSKYYIEIKDGITLCDNIIKKANEKVNIYSNAVWKNILPKEKPLLENKELKPRIRMDRSL